MRIKDALMTTIHGEMSCCNLVNPMVNNNTITADIVMDNHVGDFDLTHLWTTNSPLAVPRSAVDIQRIE